MKIEMTRITPSAMLCQMRPRLARLSSPSGADWSTALATDVSSIARFFSVLSARPIRRGLLAEYFSTEQVCLASPLVGEEKQFTTDAFVGKVACDNLVGLALVLL